MFQSDDDPALALPSPSPTASYHPWMPTCGQRGHTAAHLVIARTKVGGEALRLELRLCPRIVGRHNMTDRQP